SFPNPIFHELQEVSIHLKKLLNKHQVAYRGKSLTKACAYFSREQALLIGNALLGGVFLVLRNLGTAGAASIEFKGKRSRDTDGVIVAFHFLESAKHQGWVFVQVSLGYIALGHLNLLSLSRQHGIGSQGSRHELCLGDSLLEIKKIACGPGLNLLRSN